jgi:RNA polymerase sigma factor (TIGR02999 family)
MMAQPMAAGADVVARLMRGLRQGSGEAKRELVAMLFPELRRLAALKMKRERVNHTLQPTALVSELYLELLKLRRLEDRAYADDQEKAAFLGLAGQIMNRMLIHHARPLARRIERVEIDAEMPANCGIAALNSVEDALNKLEEIDPRFRTVVEMKIFEGRTGGEIAQLLGCSPRTVASCWNFARNWLRKEWLGKQM